MRIILNLLVTFLMYILIPLSLISFSVIIIILLLFTGPFDKNLRILHQFSCFWGFFYIWSNPYWSVEIEGKENFKQNKNYVMISNHQSMSDILAIYSTFLPFKWIAKAELFKAPFVGLVLTLNRYIKINRTSRTSMARMVNDAVNSIKKGNTVMIFPEGTRSKDGNMRKFKDGAAYIAIKSEIGFLPIMIDSTYKAVFVNGFLKEPVKIKMRILPEVTFDEIKDSTPKEISQKMHDLIENELNAHRKLI